MIKTKTSKEVRSLAPQDLPVKDLVEKILEVAVGQKALDIRCLDLRKITDLSDFFIILSGTSHRHVLGIVDRIKETLHKFGESDPRISGYESGEWVLMDYSDIVVHVFFEPARQFYALDDLWSRAQVISLPPEIDLESRKLRTGLYRN